MKFGIFKSLGHNIADSLASGIGLMIGCYEMDVFAEAASESEGFVLVDFLAGTASGQTISADLRKVVALYKEALPELCTKHGLAPSDFTLLEARFGTDRVYGQHFTVTVARQDGRQSIDHYLGVPGKRWKRRKTESFN
jgi:hypothetical protein